jgi:uncharacterized membrane protein YcaP (DUF421 family)
MGYLIDVDWARLFRPEMSLLEVLIRGVVVYITLCLLLRIILKRQAGKIGLADLLVVTIVSGVCRNPLVRDAYSLPDGLAVVVVVLCLSYSLDFLCYYSPRIHALLHPSPVVLIRDGAIDKESLRHELMTEAQLLSQLRQHGLQTPVRVAAATLEGSGQVSVILRTPQPASDGPLLDQPVTVLRQHLAWHDEQIRKHQAAATTLKDLLSSDAPADGSTSL